MEARDEAERLFFDQGVWLNLPRNSVGVLSLRNKLSNILFDQIRVELPHLIKDMEKQLRACQTKMLRLGPSRVTIDQQRLFLLKISQDFQAIVKAAVDGSYGSSFFGDPRSAEGYSKRLRAVIQNLNVDFARTMRLRGANRRVVEEADQSAFGTVSRADLITEVLDLLRLTRGRELPGMYSPLIIGDLFFEQSRPWEGIARAHIERTWSAARVFLELLLPSLTDNVVSDLLLGRVIDPSMQERLSILNQKLDELMKPYREGHPITYNHYFTETIQKIKERRQHDEIARRLRTFMKDRGDDDVRLRKKRVPALLSALTATTEADMDRFACSEIIDCMEAYYKTAMKTFIDNIAVQIIEWCLISNLPDLFSPSQVLEMDGDLIRQVAGESLESQALREQTQQKLVTLQQGLRICRAHVIPKSTHTILGSSLEVAPHSIAYGDLDFEKEVPPASPDDIASVRNFRENLLEDLPDCISILSDSDASPRQEPVAPTLPAVEEASSWLISHGPTNTLATWGSQATASPTNTKMKKEKKKVAKNSSSNGR